MVLFCRTRLEASFLFVALQVAGLKNISHRSSTWFLPLQQREERERERERGSETLAGATGFTRALAAASFYSAPRSKNPKSVPKKFVAKCKALPLWYTHDVLQPGFDPATTAPQSRPLTTRTLPTEAAEPRPRTLALN